MEWIIMCLLQKGQEDLIQEVVQDQQVRDALGHHHVQGLHHDPDHTHVQDRDHHDHIPVPVPLRGQGLVHHHVRDHDLEHHHQDPVQVLDLHQGQDLVHILLQGRVHQDMKVIIEKYHSIQNMTIKNGMKMDIIHILDVNIEVQWKGMMEQFPIIMKDITNMIIEVVLEDIIITTMTKNQVDIYGLEDFIMYQWITLLYGKISNNLVKLRT
jgi:hypothetical protein